MVRKIKFFAGKTFLFDVDWNGDDENLVDIPYQQLRLEAGKEASWSAIIGHPDNDISTEISVLCWLDDNETAFFRIHGRIFDEGDQVIGFEPLSNEFSVPKDTQKTVQLFPLPIPGTPERSEHGGADSSMTISNERF